jgi:hypothetical protein
MMRGQTRAHFDGVSVFSATMPHDRANLGERVTEWLSARPNIEVRDSIVLQSSDSAFHCLSITVFYGERTR